jgi:fibronectin type 3 domain-containing protein
MKIVTKSHWQTIAFAAIAVLFIFGASASTSAQDEYPKPDFSAMEKWYEIVKYEYGDLSADRTLTVFFKPKVESRPYNFLVQYINKDGVVVRETSVRNYIALANTRVGETVKTDAYTPSETEMEKITSVRIFRKKD